MFTCKFEKRSEVGVQPNDRLDPSTPNRGKIDPQQSDNPEL